MVLEEHEVAALDGGHFWRGIWREGGVKLGDGDG